MSTFFDKCRRFTKVKEVKEAGLYPYFHELQSRQDTEVVMEGARRIMLGSNNYLGLTVHPEVVAAAREAIDTLGTGCSGSRFLNGTLHLHVQFEKEIAEFLHKEEAVVFPTGFQSNLGIISGLCGMRDTVFCDRENHASIYDGCRLSGAKLKIYHHSDMAMLEELLAETPIESGKLIITDGVFSMGGDLCRLPEIVALAEKYNAAVMVDDAHGFGVVGDGGRGTASYFGLEDKVDLIMGTFSKSLASIGGYLVASREVAEYVRHTSRPFIFSASVPPASTASALAALRLIKAHPELTARLASLSAYFKQALAAGGVRVDSLRFETPIVPLHTKDMVTTLRIAKTLFERGVYVNPVLPPATSPDDCLLRVSLMASHKESQLDEAAEIIIKTLGEEGLLEHE